MIIGGSGSGKTSISLNQINHQPDTDKTDLYAKDLDEEISILNQNLGPLTWNKRQLKYIHFAEIL